MTVHHQEDMDTLFPQQVTPVRRETLGTAAPDPTGPGRDGIEPSAIWMWYTEVGEA